MLPDEVLRLPNDQSLVLLRGQKPLLLNKIIPDELPSFKRLVSVRIVDYIPEWRRAEEEEKNKTDKRVQNAESVMKAKRTRSHSAKPKSDETFAAHLAEPLHKAAPPELQIGGTVKYFPVSTGTRYGAADKGITSALNDYGAPLVEDPSEAVTQDEPAAYSETNDTESEIPESFYDDDSGPLVVDPNEKQDNQSIVQLEIKNEVTPELIIPT
jgi:hypothetical protein